MAVISRHSERQAALPRQQSGRTVIHDRAFAEQVRRAAEAEDRTISQLIKRALRRDLSSTEQSDGRVMRRRLTGPYTRTLPVAPQVKQGSLPVPL